MEGDRVSAIVFENLESGEQLTITSGYILDATEEGDAAVNRMRVRRGGESAGSTGEPHALDGPADPYPAGDHLVCCPGVATRATTPIARRAMSSGKTTGPTSGRDLLGWLTSGTRDGQTLEPSAVLRVR